MAGQDGSDKPPGIHWCQGGSGRLPAVCGLVQRRLCGSAKDRNEYALRQLRECERQEQQQQQQGMGQEKQQKL